MDLLSEIAERCTTEGWDGCGAPPVSDEAFAKARAFIAAFPPDLPAPEVGASPSGEILFDWIQSQDRLVTVAIDGEGKVNFASISGGASDYDHYLFEGTFDPRIEARIRELFP